MAERVLWMDRWKGRESVSCGLFERNAWDMNGGAEGPRKAECRCEAFSIIGVCENDVSLLLLPFTSPGAEGKPGYVCDDAEGTPESGGGGGIPVRLT